MAVTLAEVIEFLLETPMFAELDSLQLSDVVSIMQIQRFRSGQEVFTEGDTGDGWFVVYDGEVEVLKESVLGSKVIARLGPRACFGEMSILDGSPRSASVRAVVPTTAFRFPRSSFQGLLDEGNVSASKLVLQIARVLAARQRTTTARLAELIRSETAADLRDHLEPIVTDASVME